MELAPGTFRLPCTCTTPPPPIRPPAARVVLVKIIVAPASAMNSPPELKLEPASRSLSPFSSSLPWLDRKSVVKGKRVAGATGSVTPRRRSEARPSQRDAQDGIRLG